MDPDDYPVDLLPPTGLASSSEDYYPTVAINALMRMLRDQSLVAHQTQVVKSLFYIFQALGMAAVPYLAKASLLVRTSCIMLQRPFCVSSRAVVQALKRKSLAHISLALARILLGMMVVPYPANPRCLAPVAAGRAGRLHSPALTHLIFNSPCSSLHPPVWLLSPARVNGSVTL